MKNLLVTGLIILITTVFVFAEKRIKESLQASPDGEVFIQNRSGLVKVIGWEKNEVLIEGTLGKYVERLDFSSDSGTITIEVVLPEVLPLFNFCWGGNCSANLVIHVPEKSSVDVDTVSAGIKISSLKNEARARSVSGDIEISGSMHKLETGSVSGNIILNGSLQDVRVKTVSSAIELNGGPLNIGYLNSISGPISIKCVLSKEIKLNAESVSSSIKLVLRENISAKFNLRSYSGGISFNEFENVIENVSISKKSARFIIGTSGGRIDLKSHRGRISVEKD